MSSNNAGFRCLYYPLHSIVKPKAPQELAVALTILAGEKLKSVMPCDYLAYMKVDKLEGYHNPIDIVRVITNRTTQWVKDAILHYDDVLRRAETLKFFIHTAQVSLLRTSFRSKAESI